MCRIPREVEPTVLHRLDGEAAHPNDALLDNRSLFEHPTVVDLGPRPKFLPDLLVRPITDVVVGIALEIHALNLRRPRTNKGETAFVQRVDQLLRRRGRLGEYAEPTEGVPSFVFGAYLHRDRRSAHPIVTIAASDHVAPQLVVLAVLTIADGWFFRVDVVQADGLGFEDNNATRVESGADEVLDDLVL